MLGGTAPRPRAGDRTYDTDPLRSFIVSDRNACQPSRQSLPLPTAHSLPAAGRLIAGVPMLGGTLGQKGLEFQNRLCDNAVEMPEARESTCCHASENAMSNENKQCFVLPQPSPAPISVNFASEVLLNTHVEDLENYMESDVLAFVGSISWILESQIRATLEWLRSHRNLRERITVILETNGGSVEATERIVNVFRAFYPSVDFIVPNFAFSAGTVMVMAGNDIYMDYFSVLGPIDPQIQVPAQVPGQSEWVSASGFLVWYDRLVNKSRMGTITTAELQLLMEKFHPAEMYRYEQARNLSRTLVEKWLTEYKFQSGPGTNSNSKAMSIAQQLSDTDKWLSHSRGIPRRTLNEELELDIRDLRQPDHYKELLTYWQVFIDYVLQRNHYLTGAVHVNKRYAANSA